MAYDRFDPRSPRERWRSDDRSVRGHGRRDERGFLERAGNVVGLACDDIGWSDVGSWDAVHELLPRDGAGNASRSEALYEDSSGNYVDARGKLVALLGVHDLIVVDTPDALLVADRKSRPARYAMCVISEGAQLKGDDAAAIRQQIPDENPVERLRMVHRRAS